MVRVEHDYRFEGPDGRRSLPELFDGRSELILYRSSSRRVLPRTPAAPGARWLPTESPTSASCMLATSPSPWHRRHLRRTYVVTPSAWVGPICPGTRSAPSLSRLTSGSTSGSASTFSCATAGRARGLAAGAAVVLVPPSRRVRRAAAVSQRRRRRGRSTLAAVDRSRSVRPLRSAPRHRRRLRPGRAHLSVRR